MAEKPSDGILQLAEQLTAGFAALSGEYQILFDQHRQLETRLSWAKQQYLDLLKRFTPDTLSQEHLVFLQDLENVDVDSTKTHPDWTDHLQRTDDPESKDRVNLIRQAQIAAVQLPQPVDDGVKIWSGPSADPKKLAVTPPERLQLEKDFTTVGTPSKLGCPFAPKSPRQSPLATPRSSMSKMSFQGRRSKRPSFTDPIRAEFCGNDQRSASAASIEGSAAVCPIRFLDQHAPEDVAKYFENHKHEIPRSHEVCIKRFQSNAEGIQALDRKYGNLVSMIQGLGQKHQPMLPKEPEDSEELGDDYIEEDKSVEKVKNWAKDVSVSLRGLTPDEVISPSRPMEDDRISHFDRPMKEVRVGESPSRPWGIQIPAKYTDAGSSSSVGSAPTASPQQPIVPDFPVEQTPKKSGKCPFDHTAFMKTPETRAARTDGLGTTHLQPEKDAESPPPPPPPHRVKPELRSPQKDTPQSCPQMVFNGPVFLGYPPDQLLALLQNSNLGNMMR